MNNQHTDIRRSRTRGFSLLELMVAVVIIGILSALAYPSFMDSIRKSRRADGIQALRSLQLAQERWRSNHTSYGTLTDIAISSTTQGGWYTLAVINPTAFNYTATATAVSGKSQTSDKANGVSCATLTVDQDKPVVSSPAGVSACWGR